MQDKMKSARKAALTKLKAMGLEELIDLAEQNKESSTEVFLKALQQDSCTHNFIRDPHTGEFECINCGFTTDGKKVVEWRD